MKKQLCIIVSIILLSSFSLIADVIRQEVISGSIISFDDKQVVIQGKMKKHIVERKKFDESISKDLRIEEIKFIRLTLKAPARPF